MRHFYRDPKLRGGGGGGGGCGGGRKRFGPIESRRMWDCIFKESGTLLQLKLNWPEVSDE